MARGRPDIANTALRIFLQEMGAAYDRERGFTPYGTAKDFAVVKAFFLGRCCYCDVDLASSVANQDHLIPMNKSALGLHAGGNIVPACTPCNAKKQGRDWREFIIERAGPQANERHARMKSFLTEYRYAPNRDLREVAEALYEEVGAVAMTLIESKIKRTQGRLTS